MTRTHTVPAGTMAQALLTSGVPQALAFDFDLVERVAGRDAFRPMSINDLRLTRQTLVMIVSCASNFDAMNQPPLPLGEADDRG